MKKFWVYFFGVLLLAFFTGCGEEAATESAVAAGTNTSAESAASLCRGCHPTQYSTWAESGHAFKITAVEGAAPAFPDFVPSVFDEAGLTEPPAIFTDGWNDVTYVIGGYGWKARFIDSNGYILTSGENGSAEAQYNLDRTDLAAGATAGITTYTTTAYPSKKYNCGYCHTTGWDSTGVKDSLEGMAGTWDYEGITCQRCHGSDIGGEEGHNEVAKRADGPSIPDVEGAPATNNFANLDRYNAMNAVCADCHVRPTGSDTFVIDPNVVPAGGKLIQHHEQAQELSAGQHANRAYGCTTCHDPHASTRYDSSATGEGIYSSLISSGNCSSTSCHSSVTVAAVYGTDHTCVDCHMPYIVKSARSFAAGAKLVDGVTALGIPTTGNVRGDIRTHIIAASTSTGATFLDANLDGSAAQIKVPVDFSCMTCHGTGGTSGPTTANEAAALLTDNDVHP